MALEITAASIMKSGLDLRPKPPPSSVTLTFTFSADSPSRLAMRSRAACGDWMQPHASHLPWTMRAVAAGGFVVAGGRRRRDDSAASRRRGRALGPATPSFLGDTLPGVDHASSPGPLDGLESD